MKNIRCVMSAPKQELGSEFGGTGAWERVWGTEAWERVRGKMTSWETSHKKNRGK